MIQRSVTLGFGLSLCFICFRFKKSDNNKVKIYDWICVLLSFAIPIYLIGTFDTLITRGGAPTDLDIVMGVLLLVLVIEATRRSVGLPLVFVAIFFLAYAFWGPYMPSLIGHRGYDIDRVASQMFITGEGIFGTPMAVMTTFVFAFIVFGCFLRSQAEQSFLLIWPLQSQGVLPVVLQKDCGRCERTSRNDGAVLLPM